MTKKILALLLAVLMLVPVFAACNETPDTPKNPGTPNVTDTPSDTPDSVRTKRDLI